MIRINLLAKKVSKKKAGVIQHLAIGGGVLALCAAVMAWFWFGQRGEISRLNQQIATAEAEKLRLKDVNEIKAKVEKEKADVERKLGIITKLQKERIIPVHLLDELTKVFNAGAPVWVTNYAYVGNGVTIEGFSLSHEALRPVVDGLEKSPYYQTVDLLYSERQAVRDREVYHFSIKAGIEQPN